MTFDLSRRLAAETLGTFFLVMAVVGSGIMAVGVMKQSRSSATHSQRAPCCSSSSPSSFRFQELILILP
jgi:glycerol uptake facilitator-like aquaporin